MAAIKKDIGSFRHMKGETQRALYLMVGLSLLAIAAAIA
jgi:hypothetical protein